MYTTLQLPFPGLRNDLVEVVIHGPIDDFLGLCHLFPNWLSPVHRSRMFYTHSKLFIDSTISTFLLIKKCNFEWRFDQNTIHPFRSCESLSRWLIAALKKLTNFFKITRDLKIDLINFSGENQLNFHFRTWDERSVFIYIIFINEKSAILFVDFDEFIRALSTLSIVISTCIMRYGKFIFIDQPDRVVSLRFINRIYLIM